MKYFAEWGVTAQGMYYIEGQIQDKDFRYTKTTFEYVVTFKTSGEGEVVMYRALNLLLNNIEQAISSDFTRFQIQAPKME